MANWTAISFAVYDSSKSWYLNVADAILDLDKSRPDVWQALLDNTEQAEQRIIEDMRHRAWSILSLPMAQ